MNLKRRVEQTWQQSFRSGNRTILSVVFGVPDVSLWTGGFRSVLVWSVVFLCSSGKGVTDRWFEHEFEGLVFFLHCAHLFWSGVLGLRFLYTFALPGLGVVLWFREGSLGLSTSLLLRCARFCL